MTTMKTVKATHVVGALAMGVVCIPAAHSQEVKPLPDIRMLLTQPSHRLADSPPTPELRDLPKAKMDKPSEQLPITVTLGDPRCLPGEDGFTDPRLLRRSRRPH